MKFVSGAILLSVVWVCSFGANAAPDVPRANRHGLIIGVGAYQDPRIAPLRGVGHDVSNARQMAEQMGVPTPNLTVLQDGEASSQRIRSELRALADRVRDGDRVFVYFSGHGARYAPLEASATCREALVPWDADASRSESLLGEEEIAAELAPVYAKADKVFIFIDACHSGGVRATTRSAGQTPEPDELAPKFTILGTASQCRLASNVRTRSVLDGARTRGAPGRNVVQFASSRPDEVSLDSPDFGGLATSSWRYCSTYADDKDASGNLSVQEIADCVQLRINSRLAGHPRFSGQTVQVSGNADFAPVLHGPAETIGPSSTAVTVPSRSLPAGAGAAASVEVAALPSNATAPAQTAGTPQFPLFPLESVVAQSDDRHLVSVEYPKKPLTIGRDYFDLSVASNRGGYVHLILQSSDRQNTYILFPNTLDQANRIRPGEVMRLPRASWKLQSQGPVGRNRMLVLVTDAPRDLSGLRGSPTGPFVKTLSDQAASRSLAWIIGSAKGSSERGCARDLASKDLIYVDQCSDSFGAALIEFDER